MTAYDLYAACFVRKPMGLEELRRAVETIHRFWAAVAQRPTQAWWAAGGGAKAS